MEFIYFGDHGPSDPRLVTTMVVI